MEYTFTERDLEKLKASLESRIKEVELWREYALKKRKRSVLERLKEEIELLERFKNSPAAKKFLEELNSGGFKFLPGEVFFLVNPYFGKTRLTYRFPEPPEKDREAAIEFYKNRWAAKLTAAKIKEIFKEREQKEGVKYLQRHRTAVVSKLVKALRSVQGSKTRFKVLRGDFRDYTLNIPRVRLFEELENLGVPEHLRRLVKNFLDAGNTISLDLARYPIKEFFSSPGFEKEFLRDTNFRAQLNLDGIVPGSPLSNLMGQLFLIDFDREMEKIAGGEGFYARFLDDFILIFPEGRISEEELRQRIRDLLLKKYALHPAVRKNPSAVWELVKLEPPRDLPAEFDFLGYAFLPRGEKLLRSVRYKTLKKFLMKYLHEYRFKPSPQISAEELAKHLSAKSAYLHRWIYNFLEVNDKKLFDDLFIKFVLPDLYTTIYSFFKAKEPQKPAREIKKKTSKLVKRIKNFFKLPLIHRILKKECAKARSAGEDCERRLTRIVKEVSERIEKEVK